MKRFVLDSGIASDYMNRRRGVFERAKTAVADGDRIGICIPILGELLYGIENSRSSDESRQKLRIAIATWTLWPFDRNAAEEYGRLAAHLKRIGRKIQVIDMQLAAIALTLGCTVVTTDSDLSAVPGLTVENWAS